MSRTRFVLVATTLSLAFASSAGTAMAGSKRCRTSPGNWNAPRGAAVVTRTPGVVSAIFDVADLDFTHVMLSGGSSTMFHATRPDPKQNSDLDAIVGRPFHTDGKVLASGNDDSTLSAGHPGVSRLNMGATYASIYGTCSHASLGTCSHGPLDAGKFVTGTGTAAIATFVAGLPTEPVYEAIAGWGGQLSIYETAGLDRVRLPQPLSNVVPGAPSGSEISVATPYSFFQFKNLGTAHQGTVPPDGLACSTFLAWAFKRSSGTTITPTTYSSATVHAALTAAHDATEDLCKDKVAAGDWFTEIGAEIANVCDKAGNQIANCFVRTDPLCKDYGEEYKSSANWTGGLTATVIAPDHILGNEATGTPWATYRKVNGAKVTIATPAVLQWASQGGVYGCWETDEHWPG